MVAMISGVRRWIMAHPNQCETMYLLPSGHPSGRHSDVDWSKPDLEKFPNFPQVGAGRFVAYLPVARRPCSGLVGRVTSVVCCGVVAKASIGEVFTLACKAPRRPIFQSTAGGLLAYCPKMQYREETAKEYSPELLNQQRLPLPYHVSLLFVLFAQRCSHRLHLSVLCFRRLFFAGFSPSGIVLTRFLTTPCFLRNDALSLLRLLVCLLCYAMLCDAMPCCVVGRR